jgi:hypothetical protein
VLLVKNFRMHTRGKRHRRSMVDPLQQQPSFGDEEAVSTPFVFTVVVRIVVLISSPAA